MEGESGQFQHSVASPSGTPAGAGGYKKGGRVKKTGPAKLHKGEMVLSHRHPRRVSRRA